MSVDLTAAYRLVVSEDIKKSMEAGSKDAGPAGAAGGGVVVYRWVKTPASSPAPRPFQETTNPLPVAATQV